MSRSTDMVVKRRRPFLVLEQRRALRIASSSGGGGARSGFLMRVAAKMAPTLPCSLTAISRVSISQDPQGRGLHRGVSTRITGRLGLATPSTRCAASAAPMCARIN